jgi:hypothetical protein
MKALDGTTAIWEVTVPTLNDESNMFSTVANGCSDQAQFVLLMSFFFPHKMLYFRIKRGIGKAAGLRFTRFSLNPPVHLHAPHPCIPHFFRRTGRPR